MLEHLPVGSTRGGRRRALADDGLRPLHKAHDRLVEVVEEPGDETSERRRSGPFVTMPTAQPARRKASTTSVAVRGGPPQLAGSGADRAGDRSPAPPAPLRRHSPLRVRRRPRRKRHQPRACRQGRTARLSRSYSHSACHVGPTAPHVAHRRRAPHRSTRHWPPESHKALPVLTLGLRLSILILAIRLRMGP